MEHDQATAIIDAAIRDLYAAERALIEKSNGRNYEWVERAIRTLSEIIETHSASKAREVFYDTFPAYELDEVLENIHSRIDLLAEIEDAEKQTDSTLQGWINQARENMGWMTGSLYLHEVCRKTAAEEVLIRRRSS